MKMSIAIKPNVCSISSFKLRHSVITQFKSAEWPSDEVLITRLHLMNSPETIPVYCWCSRKRVRTKRPDPTPTLDQKGIAEQLNDATREQMANGFPEHAHGTRAVTT